jgi:hypothetical protein
MRGGRVGGEGKGEFPFSNTKPIYKDSISATGLGGAWPFPPFPLHHGRFMWMLPISPLSLFTVGRWVINFLAITLSFINL